MTTDQSQQTRIPETIYASLAGPIDQAMTQRVFNAGAIAINSGVKTIHIVFHSLGGSVGDGVALYNYFRALPIELHFYNLGVVASIATIAFLGAQHRHASAKATFSIHQTYFNPTTPTDAARARGMANSLEIDDTRTQDILRKHLTIDAERLKEHLVHELPFTADEALKCGLITEIQEFVLPPGNEISSI